MKPQNVRLGDDGRVCLLDFGSARLDAASQLTQTGTTVGTPEYMAPELFAASVYDPRVDIYGLGATLYECLTGRPPQTADSLAELAFLRTTTDVAPVRSLAPEVPTGLAQVVDRCLGRDPEDRYASAGLVSWALDHPEAEAAFAARRSSLPPCLHCGTAIPADSSECARCHTRRPFAYGSGRWHVQIRSLREPARFIEHVAEQFPERATPGHLQALTERCAALSFGAQTYAAGIFGPEAARVKSELESVGAEVKLVKGRRIWGPFWVALLCSCLVACVAGRRAELPAALFLGFLLFGVGFTLWNAPMLGRAGSSVLSISRWPRSLIPALASMSVSGLVFAALGALVPVVMKPHWYLTSEEWLALFLVPSAMILTALSTFAFGFKHPRLSRQQEAQPGFRAQLEIVSEAGKDALDSVHAGISKPRTVASSPRVVVLALLGLIATEWCLLSASWEWMDLRSRWAPAKPVPAQQPAKIAQSQEVAKPRPATRPPLVRGEWPPARHTRPSLDWPYAIPFAPLPLLLAFLYLRHRRIRKDSAVLFSELNLTRFETLAARDVPIRRPVLGGQRANPIVALRTGDAFFADALRRAAELAPCLPGPAVERLTQTLEAVCKRIPAHQMAERSLTARCILETDPEQKTRFDFLALEGQMEALAAQTWAAGVAKRS